MHSLLVKGTPVLAGTCPLRNTYRATPWRNVNQHVNRSTSIRSHPDGSGFCAGVLAGLVLDAWAIVFRLMEDEDDVVRDAAAACAQEVLVCVTGRTSLSDAQVSCRCHEHILAGGHCVSSGTLPTEMFAQVELVVREGVQLLVTCLAGEPQLHAMLIQWLNALSLEPTLVGCCQADQLSPRALINVERALHQSSVLHCFWLLLVRMFVHFVSLETQITQVRRLFDKELENQHEEPMFLAQLAAMGISAIVQQGGDESALMDESLSAWVPKAISQLGEIGKRLVAVGKQGNPPWIGGAINHPDIFKAAYTLLLGLHVSFCTDRRGGKTPDWLCHAAQEAAEAVMACLSIQLPPSLERLAKGAKSYVALQSYVVWA